MRPSPSGQFVATVVDGPLDDGVKTWVVVITDTSGAEEFRDTDRYSTRHGVGVTWLSTADELWLLSSDAGTSRVARTGDAWTKTRMTPETITQIPDEIKALQ